jgi:hypothetical protein
MICWLTQRTVLRKAVNYAVNQQRLVTAPDAAGGEGVEKSQPFISESGRRTQRTESDPE